MCLGSTRHTLFRKMGRQGKEKTSSTLVLFACKLKTCCWCNSFGQPWFLGWKFCQKATLIFFLIGKTTLLFSKTTRQKFHPFYKVFVFGGERHHRVCLLPTLVATVATIWKKKVPLNESLYTSDPVFLFQGEFSPNFDLKKNKMISTYTKDFSCNNKWPKFTRLWRFFFFFKSPDFYDEVPVGSQEYRKILLFFKNKIK
jgi:hypothetical protein